MNVLGSGFFLVINPLECGRLPRVLALLIGGFREEAEVILAVWAVL